MPKATFKYPLHNMYISDKIDKKEFSSNLLVGFIVQISLHILGRALLEHHLLVTLLLARFTVYIFARAVELS